MKYSSYAQTILMMGNGFDLYYLLPTQYINFLNTIVFLESRTNRTFRNVGDVFCDIALQKSDDFIKQSYEKHKEIYNSCELDPQIIDEIVYIASNNAWFKYFKQKFKKDAGWIDFEKEIANVLHKFKCFFMQGDISLTCKGGNDDILIENLEMINVLSYFNDIFEDSKNIYYLKLKEDSQFVSRINYGDNKIINNYGYEEFVRINKRGIIKYLSKELQDFSTLLKMYLFYFVEKPIEEIHDKNALKLPVFMQSADTVVSFNYTRTYEMSSRSNNADVVHIHGDVYKDIVLGINVDLDDFDQTVDTSFLQFKKYYQRTYYDTETKYLELIDKYKCIINRDKRHAEHEGILYEPTTPILLVVHGHSLDITDKDIIEVMFDIATHIKIYYHNNDAKKNYIENIIKIFGKEKYDMLRKEKNLTFIQSKTCIN